MTYPSDGQSSPGLNKANANRTPSRSGRPWLARWDTPAAGVPRRFGAKIAMLLIEFFLILFCVTYSFGTPWVAFAIIATMVGAVAVGQTLLFGGRYPRAASIWVGAYLFPLQFMALWCLAYEESWSGKVAKLIAALVVSLLVSIAVGACLGYLTGKLVGGMFFIVDLLERSQFSQRDAVEAAERGGPTNVLQSQASHEGDGKQGEKEFVASPGPDPRWGARWDTPAAGVPRRFGVGVLMLLMTMFAVLFSVLRSFHADVGVFALFSTMFAAVAVGQVLLFGGRYPRAASIWVGSCFFPLQLLAAWPSIYLGRPWTAFQLTNEWLSLLMCWVMSLLITVPAGACIGYLVGGLVGGVVCGVSLIRDAVAPRRRDQYDRVETAKPPKSPETM